MIYSLHYMPASAEFRPFEIINIVGDRTVIKNGVRRVIPSGDGKRMLHVDNTLTTTSSVVFSVAGHDVPNPLFKWQTRRAERAAAAEATRRVRLRASNQAA
jgi:hypothetical protein